MRASARYSAAHSAFDADDQYWHDELSPGERIGRPLARTGRKALLRGIIIVLAIGGVWALLGDQVTLPRGLLKEIGALWASMNRSAPGPVERAASAVTTPSWPSRSEPGAKSVARDAPSPISQPPPWSASPATSGATEAPLITTTALPPTATRSEEVAAEPLPPPTVDPADPYQVRAMAVGLHPDLSRVLLARLSPADYRNAGIAIQTAVAETPDNAVFVWPRQRKPELALFQIRFVRGAAPSCRRYVVSITKDGWLTTAPPMEKCGPQRVGQQHR
jgi:hypothetical protein